MATVKRKGRGRSPETYRFIDAMKAVAEPVQPCSVRAIAYPMFNQKLIPSMATKNVQKVSRLSVIAREEGIIPWEWIVDPTRQEQRIPTWDDPESYARAVQRSYRVNKWQAQPKHVSVWS